MKGLYAIRDRIASALVGNSMYLIFAFRTDNEAIRYFADAVLDEKSILARHAADYELVKVGELHDTAAGEVVEANGTHTVIVTGDAVVGLYTTHQPSLVKEA